MHSTFYALSPFQNVKAFKYFQTTNSLSCVGILSFTDTVLGQHSDKCTVTKAKKHNIKKEKKGEGVIISHHNSTVALSSFEAMYALSSVIGLFVIREHFPLFKQTSQCCRSGEGEEGGGGAGGGLVRAFWFIFLSRQINYNAD